ncbi:hypothetical protein GCM10010123_10520 [Pilimelia anulata]|uniref:Uncharacterized protein n=1 Tax=Pilimelia anulata TaxID=53371 RepID=A0A8J3F835_9ACTN|nr:Tat pathway signal sequence domain protein [Pilimelia anulata]GGJ82762.1 hypothetical protein GCM10010123_10520 [Pilimelia anulata]
MTAFATAAPPAPRASAELVPTRTAAARSAARSRAFVFLDTMMDAAGGGPADLRLPQSYADQMGLHATAFTYDAAIAILAYLTDPGAPARARARLLGDALLYAQEHDPDFADGRLRQAYTVGPFAAGGVTQPYGFIRPDGTVNTDGPFDFRSSHTGDLAWAGIALATLGRRTGLRRYTVGAARLGAWIVAKCRSAGPLRGFGSGVDGTGRTLPSVTTAQNAALIVLFGALAAATGDAVWLRQRAHAERFVARLWSGTDECWSALSPDGAAIDRGAATLEAQLHPWLAAVRLRSRPALEFVHRALTVTDTADRANSALPPGTRITGATFSSASRVLGADGAGPDPYAVWCEGTAQYACAARRDARAADRWPDLVDTLVLAQERLGAGQTAGGRALPPGAGLVAATGPLPTGDSASGYFPVRHVGTTAWFVLAHAGVNPLRH